MMMNFFLKRVRLQQKNYSILIEKRIQHRKGQVTSLPIFFFLFHITILCKRARYPIRYLTKLKLLGLFIFLKNVSALLASN